MTPPLLEAARDLAPGLRAASDRIEKEGRLPPEVVESLARAGLFRMLVPRSLGGGEVSPAVMVEAIEAVSRGDSAAGWCVMVGATSGLLGAYLEPEAARLVYGDELSVCSGVFAPGGTAEDLGDSYRVTGRWPFSSGVLHAGWRMGGAVVTEGGAPKIGEGGAPMLRHVFFRAEETSVVETWDTSGLRGTGSHDLVAEGVVVPKSRTVSMLAARPREEGALYRFPMFGLLALGVSAVALGIARAALDDLAALARAKKPGGGKRTLAERELVQFDVGRAEGLVRSARAFALEAARETFAAVEAGPPGDESRAVVRLAATQATTAAAEAVGLCYRAGGSTSIYAKSPLQRHFRDVNVATQHGMVGGGLYALAGRVLLGQRTDVTTL